MSDDQTTTEETAAAADYDAVATTSDSSTSDSITKAQSAIEALTSILPSVPLSLSSSSNPSFSLLHDPETASQISSLLRQPDSGAGNNSLCRWLYDTFQCSDPNLQLVVLRFIPIIAGVYLSRVALCKPLAGFEAVLLALYAHETSARNSQSVTVNVPDLSNSSIYHEINKMPTKNNNTSGLNLAVVSPSLEPFGTVRSTKRARIVGVALELYYSKISQMPVGSKIDFCEFCVLWAGQDSEVSELSLDEKPESKARKIPLPWELLQPVLRILGHCLLGPSKDKDLYDAAMAACRSLYTRSSHEIDSKAILATGSLLNLGKMALDQTTIEFEDPTEIPKTNVISL